MSPETVKSMTMMAIALPTMFTVIIGFIAATTCLGEMLRYDPSKESYDD